MTECIAMAVGFMMGAGCVLGALAVGKPSQSLRDSSPEGGAKGLASPFGRGGSADDGEGETEAVGLPPAASEDFEELYGEDGELPF